MLVKIKMYLYKKNILNIKINFNINIFQKKRKIEKEPNDIQSKDIIEPENKYFFK